MKVQKRKEILKNVKEYFQIQTTNSDGNFNERYVSQSSNMKKQYIKVTLNGISKISRNILAGNNKHMKNNTFMGQTEKFK